jgi:8-oxo-dGTP pyrophosphatase MutT (NUDIX family)
MAAQNTSVHGVYFDSQGRVLLVKDASSSFWGFPGGGTEEGETHKDTLHREFLEETGMDALGNPVYITQQSDGIKRRYFYKVEKVKGQLGATGNDLDIESTAYYNPLSLSVSDLAPGIEDVIKHCQQNL